MDLDKKIARLGTVSAVMRWLVFSLLVAVLVTGTAFGQDAVEYSTSEADLSVAGTENVQVSAGQIDDISLEMFEEFLEHRLSEEGIIETTEIIVPEDLLRHPAAEVYTGSEADIPVLHSYGEYLDPSGLCSQGVLSDESNKDIRSSMLRAQEMGFRAFILRVDWPSVEPEPNRFDSTRVQEMLEYAGELGLHVIVSIDINRAPAWFFRGTAGNERVTSSYLVDPEMERSPGSDGDLRWNNGTGVPLPYHEDTVDKVKNLVYSLYYTLKDESALLGWHLNGPITYGFPGGGTNGVVGMSDYSLYTINKFYATTGIPLVYPLPRSSQGTWDKRIDFRIFWGYRQLWRRAAFKEIISAFREVDNEHLVLIGMDPVLSYRQDNGYLSMVRNQDSTWQLMQGEVSGALVNFRLSSDSFDAVNERTECSAMHLALTINQVIRNGRLAIVMVESDADNPPRPSDIVQLAYMLKAAGAYPVWCSGFAQRASHRWTTAEENAIEQAQALSLLPPPQRLRRGDVAIFDLPGFYSSFYSEQNGSIKLALVQLAIHQRTGLLLEVVGIDEVMLRGRSAISDYLNLMYLVPEMVTVESARETWLDILPVNILNAYAGGTGRIEATDTMLLHQYKLSDYDSGVLESQARTRYVSRGASADLLHNADAFILANDPYVFVRINNLHGTRWIDVALDDWPEANLDHVGFKDLQTGDFQSVGVTGGNASFNFSAERKESHLFILSDDYASFAEGYETRINAIAVSQQVSQMRKSIPIALLFAALLAVTMVWMTFQSQQKSLIQAAELVEKRRSIDTIDILDQPEVREFYETYISADKTKPPDDYPDPDISQMP